MAQACDPPATRLRPAATRLGRRRLLYSRSAARAPSIPSGIPSPSLLLRRHHHRRLFLARSAGHHYDHYHRRPLPRSARAPLFVARPPAFSSVPLLAARLRLGLSSRSRAGRLSPSSALLSRSLASPARLGRPLLPPASAGRIPAFVPLARRPPPARLCRPLALALITALPSLALWPRQSASAALPALLARSLACATIDRRRLSQRTSVGREPLLSLACTPPAPRQRPPAPASARQHPASTRARLFAFSLNIFALDPQWRAHLAPGMAHIGRHR